jgi:hypothetical protein
MYCFLIGFPYSSAHLASSPSSRGSLESAALGSNPSGLLEGETGDRQDAAARRLLFQSQFAKNFMQMGGLHGLGKFIALEHRRMYIASFLFQRNVEYKRIFAICLRYGNCRRSVSPLTTLCRSSRTFDERRCSVFRYVF